MTTDAMKDSIAHIVRVAARDGAAIGPERLLAYLPSTSVDDAIADLDRAITAHVEAEVARRLAAAPDVEVAIVDYALAAQGDFDTSEERDALRAAIAADKARAVEALKSGMRRVFKCSTHEVDPTKAWGCPDCLVEMRASRKEQP